MLELGTKALIFSLHDGNRRTVSLHDFASKMVVLYFYPKGSVHVR